MTMRDDPIINLKIVQLVEKYPKLYDFTLDEHSAKAEVNKAWDEIGEQLSMPGNAVRDRWRVLRGSYVRFMRQKNVTDPKKPKKPYYLANYMKYVEPFLKTREIGAIPTAQTSTRSSRRARLTKLEKNRKQSSSEQSDDSDELINKNNKQFLYLENDVDPIPDNIELSEPVASATSSQVTNTNRTTYSIAPLLQLPHVGGDDNLNQSKEMIDLDIKRKRNEDEDENPDMHFFKSLLPEMSQLVPFKKNKFKVQILNALNQLLYDE